MNHAFFKAGLAVFSRLPWGQPIFEIIEQMDTLLEDYRKRLQATMEAINKLKFKDNANPEYLKLTIKAGCYKIMIAELENALGNQLSYNQ